MRRYNPAIIAITIFIIAFLAVLFFYLNKEQDPSIDKEEKITFNYPEGSVKACAQNPGFPEQYGLTPPYLIDLRQKGFRGLRLIEYRENGQMLQLPEWSEFGWLGLYTVDNKGNTFITPIPQESLINNPLGEQNRILKLDATSGKLEVFMDLPQKKASTLKNPFGSMGIIYDCDNGFMYVSSIAGSSAREELGQIFHVDPEKKKVISKIDNIDAIGLNTYNLRSGKRLYFGAARSPEVFSVSIDKSGKIGNDSRLEFSLLDFPGGSDERAHKIRFKDNRMIVKASEFNYTLAVSSDPQRNIYDFVLNESGEGWSFIGVRPEKKEVSK